MKILLNSKSILAASALAAGSIIAGNKFCFNSSLVVGALIETTKLTIHYLEQKADLKRFKADNEIAYLVDLKQKTEKRLTKKST